MNYPYFAHSSLQLDCIKFSFYLSGFCGVKRKIPLKKGDKGVVK